MKLSVLSACVVALGIGSSARAVVIVYDIPLDGLQVVPPVATPGSGVATVTMDTTANTLSWDLSWFGLVGNVTGIAFHGDAAAGANAGIQLNIIGVVSPEIGSAALTEAQEASIYGGLWYINIRTQFRPAGEIRGQVVPAPGVMATAGVAGLLCARRRRA